MVEIPPIYIGDEWGLVYGIAISTLNDNVQRSVCGEVLDIGAATESLAAVFYHTVDKIMPETIPESSPDLKVFSKIIPRHGWFTRLLHRHDKIS